jgi:Domain of unknown function DUF29
MTDRTTLRKRLEALPDDRLEAVEQFIDYLENQSAIKTLGGLSGESPNYETDFYRWTQDQAAILRTEKLQWLATLGLDLKHLAEEVRDLGDERRFAIESHLARLLLHLLKYRYDPAQDPRRGWRLTIRDARREIAKRAVYSLRDYPAQYLATAYRYAREDAPDATGLPLTMFPEACEWSAAEVLSPDFWPEAQP